MPPGNRVTGQDVADRAGVSRATVSYVLNDAPGQPISAETRARVLAAAADLGYTPDAAARRLRTGTSDLVLLALPPFPVSNALTLAISSFTQQLGVHGYTALVDPVTEDVTHLERTLARLQPIALVATADLLTPALVDRLHTAGTRSVMGFGDQPMGFTPTVVFDQSEITRIAMTHLFERGHRAVVAVMPDDLAFQWFRAPRQQGAEAAAAALGMTLTVVECPLDHHRVTAVVADSLASGDRPDAILAYNDDYALLALRSLVDAGIRVPEDVAVIGCDNLPVAELFTPRLTTVDIDMTELGLRIADTLHQMLLTGEGPDVIPFPTPAIVQRESA